MKKKIFLSLFTVFLLGLILTGCKDDSNGSAEDEDSITLKLSHQWPKATDDEDSDFRSQLAQDFSDQVEEESNGSIEVELYPSSSLVDSEEQYDAMLKGSLEMSVYPLDYAGGKVPEWGVTLMPALVKDHEQAQNWENSDIGDKIEEISKDNGVKILTWIWNAGAIGSKGKPITTPEDVKNNNPTMRAAGSKVEDALEQSGASITSMSSDEMYQAFQTGVLDAGISSSSSFGSYKLYEQVDYYTSPQDNTFWFMFEPLVISTEAFDKLSEEQQDIVEEVGEDLQEQAYEESENDDEKVAEMFEDEGVEIETISDEDFQEWEEVSNQVWENFSDDVDGGEELIDLAKEIEE